MDWNGALDVASKASVVVAVAAYLLQRRSMHLQHARARREKATSAILEFTKTFSARSAAARKLIRRFDTSQIDNLDEGRVFSIAHEDRELLLAALPDHITEEQIAGDTDIVLTRNQSFLLRWEIISLLNSCEVVAQCWLTDVAHKETIEQELLFLLEAPLRENIMTKCGKLAAPARFPALAALMNVLEGQRSDTPVPVILDGSWWRKLLGS